MTGVPKQSSRKGTAVYEEVLQKNFEIIENFLKKFHQIFISTSFLYGKGQDQFEEHLNRFSVKFNEYDDALEAFRNQQKLSLVMLEKKVNSIKVNARESHRLSHRKSKENFSVLQTTQIPQNRTNFTLMKFDTLEQPLSKEETTQAPVQRKQTAESDTVSLKNYDSIKETIDLMKQDMAQMKDKVAFLSVYASQIDGQQVTKNKMDMMKKQVIQNLETQFNQKLQKQLRKQIIETQKVFMQQINNLTTKNSSQLAHQIQQKTQFFQFELDKINQKFSTKKEKQELEQNIEKNLKEFAEQSMKTFVQKQEMNKCLNHIEKRIKSFEGEVKIEFQRSEKDKRQAQYFSSLLQVSTPNKKSSRILQKSSKSPSQWSKNISRSLQFSLPQSGDIKERQKQNYMRKSSSYQSVENLSKGSLITSKVSRQFMKNFGVKQKKLEKRIFTTSKKSSYHINQFEIESGIQEKPPTQENQHFQKHDLSP